MQFLMSEGPLYFVMNIAIGSLYLFEYTGCIIHVDPEHTLASGIPFASRMPFRARHRSRVQRLKAKVEPLSTLVTVETRAGDWRCGIDSFRDDRGDWVAVPVRVYRRDPLHDLRRGLPDTAVDRTWHTHEQGSAVFTCVGLHANPRRLERLSAPDDFCFRTSLPPTHPLVYKSLVRAEPPRSA